MLLKIRQNEDVFSYQILLRYLKELKQHIFLIDLLNCNFPILEVYLNNYIRYHINPLPATKLLAF